MLSGLFVICKTNIFAVLAPNLENCGQNADKAAGPCDASYKGGASFLCTRCDGRLTKLFTCRNGVIFLASVLYSTIMVWRRRLEYVKALGKIKWEGQKACPLWHILFDHEQRKKKYHRSIEAALVTAVVAWIVYGGVKAWLG